MEKQLHILHVIGAKKAGGAETFALRLIAAQHADSRFKVTCIAREGSWMEEQLREMDIPTMVAPFGQFLDFRTKAIIKNAVDVLGVDVIQGWMNRACSKLPHTNVPTLGRMGGYYKLKNYDACHVVAGNTTKICDYLLENNLESEDVAYLPNFTEDDTSNDEDRLRIRTELGISNDMPVAIIAGRIHRVKGVDTAIKAIAKLKKMHLIVLGEGPEKGDMQELAKSESVADRVHFLGWQRYVSPFAAAADMWWVLSRHEPLGNVVLDGWMHQKAVVATKADGPTLLIEEGQSGFLVDIDDVDGVVAATQRVLGDASLKKSLEKCGYDKVQSTYSKKAILGIYYDTYMDMINHEGHLKSCAYKQKKAV